ncbi:MAG: LAGLIDADG family homing endonuclease [Bacteroidota bacterium]
MQQYKKKNVISSETKREDINSEQKWAVGIIDGDGHIGLEWTNKENTKWVPVLKVTLHKYNSRAIYRLKKILRIGKITYSGNTITYRVRSKALWHSILIPLFDEFHLRSMKYAAALVIKKALYMVQVGNATPKNILKLQQSLDRKTDPISPIWKNGTGLKEILDLDWLAGFIEAEGSFYILSNGQHGFAIGQAYDQHIIIGIHRLFNVQSKLKNRNSYIMLDTKNTEALYLIANAINKRLLGIKSFEFSLWLRTLRKKNKVKTLKAKSIIALIRKRYEK